MRFVSLLLASVVLAACQASSPASTIIPAASPEPTGDTAVLHAATPVPESCAVTKAVAADDVPPAVLAVFRQTTSSSNGTSTAPPMVGNDAFWTTLPADGSLTKDDKIVSVSLVDGPFTASARRIDGNAAPAALSGPSGTQGGADAPNRRGLHVWGITFSSLGCWEITQTLTGRTLKHVVWVGVERPR